MHVNSTACVTASYRRTPNSMISGRTQADTAAEAPDRESATEPSRWNSLGLRIWGWVSSESLLLAVLVSSFLARLLIVDRNSYWLDELYSVTIHGTWNQNVGDLVRVLAENTVYPPVYFVVLFQWMDWFGDSELVTRLLSIIYITFAGLFLYLALRLVFSRRIALASLVTFNLMYTPMYYGLETRPYSQTMFLVAVSSYLLLRILQSGVTKGWRRALVSPTGSMFVVANSLLLLTHYYNAFFWIAQALVACIFVLCDVRPRVWLKGLGAVAALYGLQAAIFIGVWGRALLHAVDRRGRSFAIASATDLPTPWSTLLDRVVLPNIRVSGLVAWIALVLAVVVGVRAIAALVRSTRLSQQRIEAWATIYLFNWLIVPVVIMYLAFLVAGVASYSDRYVIFSVMPLAPLVVLGVEQAARLVAGLTGRLRAGATHPDVSQKVWAILLSIAVMGLLIYPGGHAGATESKADWRGAARDIVDLVESNPESSYVIYEPSFRPTPLLDYYLARYSDDVRVTGTIPRLQERRAEEDPNYEFGFERDAELIGQYDYIVVPFMHHSTRHFPIALDRLREAYDVQHWGIDDNGKGLAIFSISQGSNQEPS